MSVTQLEETAHRRLCAAMIEQAIKDLTKTIHNKKTGETEPDIKVRKEARQWFDAKGNEPGSYLWCLDNTSLNQNSVRRYLDNYDKTDGLIL